MKPDAALVPAADLYPDTLESDIAMLARGGLPALSAALAELAETDVPVDETVSHLVLAETLCALLACFDHDTGADAITVIAALSPDQAAFMHDMLLHARFEGGSGDTALLDDAAVLVLAAMTVATDRPAAAIDLLDDEATRRGDDFSRPAAAVHAYADTAIFAL
ncbi:hypothetical protein ASE75_04685 [Sphingomonas sp. Leaf17]|uniref:hypothetical protein n=1 Tax=Sphingomonas sp. Leaf17 TaxID=1735683 RepID=UPI0006F85212|nr:hypothetical protein [Sphingomonas sp. Leaf17]KQM65560.1 hypothetical protein ASE75_04685 [Sphingomonas sp. Leaf17]